MNNASLATVPGLPGAKTLRIASTAAVALDRRLFLAAGPAAAVMASLRKAAAEESQLASPLAALIEQHRQALAAYKVACQRQDELTKGAGDAVHKQVWEEWKQCDADECEALDAVLSYSARDMGEARAKAAYLLNFDFNCDFSADAQASVRALLQSFLA